MATTELRWLLILDDVNCDISSFIPADGHGSIVVTARNITFANVTPMIEVCPLNNEEGGQILSRHLQHICSGILPPLFKTTELEIISKKIGGNPNILRKIAFEGPAYQSSARILKRFDRRDYIESILEDGTAAVFDGLPVVSWNILSVLAYLDEDYICEELLLLSGSINCMDIGCATTFSLEDTVLPLFQRGIVGINPGRLTIQRDMQLNVLRRLDRFMTHRNDAFNFACVLVSEITSSSNKLQKLVSGEYNGIRAAMPHILRLLDNFRQTPPPRGLNLAFAQLLHDAGQECWARMLVEEGLAILEAALVVVQTLQTEGEAEQAMKTMFTVGIQEQSPIVRHKARILEGDISALLGVMKSQSGFEGRQQSTTYRGMALDIRYELFNKLESTSIPTREDEMRLRNGWSDYSIGLLYQEEFEEADSIMEECRECYEQWESVETLLPYEYAKYYFVKSFTLMAAGQSVQALQASQHAIELIKEESHDTWLFSHYKFVQATMHHHAGRTAEALAMHEAVLAERAEGCFQLNEVRCLESMYMVGALRHVPGDHDGARSICELILQDDREESYFGLWELLRKLKPGAPPGGDHSAVPLPIDIREYVVTGGLCTTGTYLP
ncbi:hypothetical protein F5B20DRAFT_577387 [Whalleya microplaca]|nr:hypothetical protein F5B20DRAFT_577387 [Whalleya microplaca]